MTSSFSSYPSGLNICMCTIFVMANADDVTIRSDDDVSRQVGGSDQRGNMVTGYELITGTTDEDVDLFGESSVTAFTSVWARGVVEVLKASSTWAWSGEDLIIAAVRLVSRLL